MASHANQAAPPDVQRLPAAAGQRLLTIAGAIAAVGILLAVAGAFTDSKRFAFSYLVGFYYTLTLSLAALVLVMIQHLTRAAWSVGPRRTLEWLGGFAPVGAVLFIPVALFAPTLFHTWWPAEGVHMPAAVEAKRAFLSPVMFYGMSALFFVIWTAVGWFFRSHSLAQDVDGKLEHTHAMQFYAPPFTFLVAYALAFSGILWVMSLQPSWFSTMWGVYIFAGGMTSALGTLAIIMVALRSYGYFNRVFTEEHQHDVGKFLFGFTVFYAYITFCQFFLIWYGNIPEETVWYKMRFNDGGGGWQPMSWALLFFQFILPFAWLLPRTIKRSKPGLVVGATILLVGHYIDMYYMVMPNLDADGPHFSWIDVGAFLAPLGVLLLWLALRASRDPLYPLRDPRLPETYRVDNGQG